MEAEKSQDLQGKLEGRISLAVQWLRVCTSTAGCVESIHQCGTKIPHAVRCRKKKKIGKVEPRRTYDVALVRV